MILGALDSRQERDGDTLTIRPRGEIDVATAPALESALAAARCARLVVDLSAVTFMDSSAIHMLIRLHQRCLGDGACRPGT